MLRRSIPCAQALFALLALLVAAAPRAAQHTRDGFSFDTGPTPAYVAAVEVPTRATLPREGSGAVYSWLNETQQDFRDGGERLYRRLVNEPLTREGLEQVAQPQIVFDPSYQRLTIHQLAVERDGKLADRFDPERVTLARRELDADRRGIHTGLVTALVVIDDVRIGDRVHFAYSVDGAHPVLGELAGDDYALALPVAQQLRYLRLLADGDHPLRLQTAPGYAPPREKRIEQTREYLYRKPAVAAIQVEPDLPPWVDPIPTLEVASATGWRQVADWARTLYPAPQPLSPELEAALARIREEHTQPEAQALAALRLVQDEVRYLSLSLGESTHRPAEPNAVYARRFGDCKDKSRLLVALLAALGIEAAPALVHSQQGHALPQRLPRAGVFDHVIVRIVLPAGAVWADPTASLQRGDFSTQGFPDFAWALPVAEGTEALVPIERPAGQVDSHLLEQTYQVAGQGAALKVQSTWTGGFAEWMRRRIAAEGIQAVREEWRGYYARQHGQLKSVGEMQVEDDDQANRLVIRDELALEQFVKAGEAHKERFDIAATVIGEFFPLPQSAQRTHPLALLHPSEVRQTVVVELPPEVLPALQDVAVEVDDPALHFERSASLRAGRFEASFSARSLAFEVSGDQLARHLDSRRRIHEAISLGVQLERTGARRDSREERMRRLLEGAGEQAP